jgi:hypothetical protein
MGLHPRGLSRGFQKVILNISKMILLIFIMNINKMNSIFSLFKNENFLGQGAEGFVYLAKDNRVIKIVPTETEELSDGDRFALEVIPTLKPEIQKHFTKVFSIKFVSEDPLNKIRHLQKYVEYDAYDKNSPYFKIVEMEYGGKPLKYVSKKIFDDLVLPVLVMNSTGYYHTDLINIDNILDDNGVYKIIDYDNMYHKQTAIREMKKTGMDPRKVIKLTVIQLLNYLIMWEDKVLQEYASSLVKDWFSKYHEYLSTDGPNSAEKSIWSILFDQENKFRYMLGPDVPIPDYVYTAYLYPLDKLRKIYEMCDSFDPISSVEEDYIELSARILKILNLV